MHQSKKIRFKGRLVPGASVEAVESTERWSEYLLEDGTVLKMKLVITNIYRLDDERDSMGNPVYVVGSSNVLAVDAPEGLRCLIEDFTKSGADEGRS